MASIPENAQALNTLSLALKAASDGKFLATEHASSIFKKALRDLGFESKKEIEPVVTKTVEVK